MKSSFFGWQLAAACALLLSPSPTSAAERELKLERVVMLMRHGIRSPTSAQPIPARYSPSPWPKWSVGPGLLTERGAKGIALVAAADREVFIKAGLLPAAGCPAAGEVTVHASKVPRAIETAQAWSKALLPGCEVTVSHPANGAPDPLFHAIEDSPEWFDRKRAYEDALAQAPAGGLAGQERVLAPEMGSLEAVLGCAAPACDLESEPTTLVERPHDRPGLQGALGVASTASESLLLEYVEGMPLAEVGWGRATPRDIERLLVLNTTKYKYVDWPPYIAKAAASPLAKAMLQALSASHGPRITLLAGHDTNVAQLGGLLGLHWQAASYPADNVPPGSALGFELLSDEQGRQFVRAFFRSQTMDQLRNLEALSSENPPHREYLEIPGCSAADAVSCDLQTFTKIVEARVR
jgi:4-phytase/acid phosphatase